MAKFYQFPFIKHTFLFSAGITLILNTFSLSASAQETSTVADTITVGYGTQKKQAITGAVSTATSPQFNQGLVVTPEQLISGQIPGLQVTSLDGAPGAGSLIQLRGNSIAPLVVLDGVMLGGDTNSGINSLSSLINPNDIATITVLRDAAATGIYGARGVNGVVLITTKRGDTAQKLKVNFRSLGAISTLPKEVEVLSADQFRQLVHQQGTQAQINLLGNSQTNWQEEIYDNTFSHDQNLSLSGGLGSMPYRLSVGYLDQKGIISNTNFKRTSAALTLNPTFFDNHLKADVSLKGITSNARFVPANTISGALSFDPTQPVHANNRYGGFFEWTDADGNYILGAPYNPVSILEQQENKGEAKRGFGNLHLDYSFHFLPALHAHVNLGYDVSKGENNTTQRPTQANVSYYGAQQSHAEETRKNKSGEFYLSYLKAFSASQSQLEVAAGYSVQKFDYDYSNKTSSVADLTLYSTNGGWIGNSVKALFGRINYSLKDRYFLTASIRRDGSPMFSEENRWFVSKTLGASWLLSNEEFLSGAAFLSELKLRASYGIQGNQGRQPGYFSSGTISTLANPGLNWGKDKTLDLGIDFSLLNNSVWGSFDFYNRTSDNLLLISSIPYYGQGSFSTILTNAGELHSKGWEASLFFKAIETQHVRWQLGMNWSHNKSEITIKDSDNNNIVTGVPTGSSMGSFYSYQLAGGNIITMNQGKSSIPSYMAGLKSQLSYLNWSLGFLARAHFGNYVYNNIARIGSYNYLLYSDKYLVNMSSSVLDSNQPASSGTPTDFYVEKASFLRMEYISLGYDFGKVLQQKAALTLAATVQNAFVLTNYSGQDPELATGTDNAPYPRPRIFSLSLNFSL